ncbi:MAG: hypothetical protein VW644_07725, partial [Alphaproteobacteria bacterium]
MGIGPSVGYWLTTLRDRGVLPAGCSLVDLGPQDLVWPEPALRRFLATHFDDAKACRAYLEQTERRNGNVIERPAVEFYRLLGVGHHESFDFGDPVATYQHNLNLPLEVERQYDVVTDFGTFEHIFNIGEAFRTAHNLACTG